MFQISILFCTEMRGRGWCRIWSRSRRRIWSMGWFRSSRIIYTYSGSYYILIYFYTATSSFIARANIPISFVTFSYDFSSCDCYVSTFTFSTCILTGTAYSCRSRTPGGFVLITRIGFYDSTYDNNVTTFGSISTSYTGGTGSP